MNYNTEMERWKSINRIWLQDHAALCFICLYDKNLEARSQCLMHVILATQEAEMGRIAVQGHPRKIFCKTPTSTK
jgi:hypothetical protein